MEQVGILSVYWANAEVWRFVLRRLRDRRNPFPWSSSSCAGGGAAGDLRGTSSTQHHDSVFSETSSFSLDRIFRHIGKNCRELIFLIHDRRYSRRTSVADRGVLLQVPVGEYLDLDLGATRAYAFPVNASRWPSVSNVALSERALGSARRGGERTWRDDTMIRRILKDKPLTVGIPVQERRKQ